jgi:hypothetical protein
MASLGGMLRSMYQLDLRRYDILFIHTKYRNPGIVRSPAPRFYSLTIFFLGRHMTPSGRISPFSSHSHSLKNPSMPNKLLSHTIEFCCKNTSRWRSAQHEESAKPPNCDPGNLRKISGGGNIERSGSLCRFERTAGAAKEEINLV